MSRTRPLLELTTTARTLGIVTVILVGVGCTSPAAQLSPSRDTSSLEPSTEPSAATLVLRLLGGGEAGQVHIVTVLDDGRVITTSPGDLGGANPPVERRLTAAGVELVRDELEATGLTDASATYMPVANPGVEAPGFGGAGPSLEVGLPDGGTAVITWYLFADDPAQDYFQPQPAAEALDALAVRLSTLEDSLPADAWADPIATPYAPESYRMVISYQPWGGSLDNLPAEIATVTWPLDVEIGAFGEALNPAPDEVRCGIVIAEDGSAVIEALEAAGAASNDQTNLSFGLGDRRTSRLVTITLEPTLPLGGASC